MQILLSLTLSGSAVALVLLAFVGVDATLDEDGVLTSVILTE